MVKCPNCGSTAQMRLFDTARCGHHLVEYWDCCECLSRFRFLFKVEHIVTEEVLIENE